MKKCILSGFLLLNNYGFKNSFALSYYVSARFFEMGNLISIYFNKSKINHIVFLRNISTNMTILYDPHWLGALD